MTFAKKVFVAVFLSTLTIGTLLIAAAYNYTISKSENEFASRYQVFTKVLGDTLNRLDTSTEALMLNAAKVIVEKDEKLGLLSTDELRNMQSGLGITHLFIVDKSGKFIRSTNDDPETIPNLFSFCENYKKLISGDIAVEATPIIKPNPEPKPFKFLSVPNHDRTRIVEVGIRADFIAKTLVEAITSDENIKAMALYAPDGTSFGTYSDKNVVFESQKSNLPNKFDDPVKSDSYFSFFTKVNSSHPRCCQCDVAGTSKNGEYYYVLESRVSRDKLKATQASAGVLFLLIGLGNGLISFILAKLISRRLVRNIELAVSKVRGINLSGHLTDRINMKTNDEISFLTQEFDRLLESREESQKKLIEAEKVKSKIEIAKIVAHNIRSPALAIEMMIPGLVMVPDRMKRVLKNAVSEIKQLSEKLKNQADSIKDEMNHGQETNLIFLPVFLDDLVKQKNLEYSKFENSEVVFINRLNSEKPFLKLSCNDLRAVLSNVINNANESYGQQGGQVRIELSCEDQVCSIKVIDQGAGIPSEYLSDLGSKRISFKGNAGRGVGLVHAFKSVESWGGIITISSSLGSGTTVDLRMPQFFGESDVGVGEQSMTEVGVTETM